MTGSWDQRAWRQFIVCVEQTDDPQEKARLLALADGEHGIWRGHSAFECSEACPQAVDPAGKLWRCAANLPGTALRRYGEDEEVNDGHSEYPKVRRAGRWFDVRQRKLGMWAYALNRIAGIGLVVYLYLHLVVLSLLLRGPGSWDAFVAGPFALLPDT